MALQRTKGGHSHRCKCGSTDIEILRVREGKTGNITRRLHCCTCGRQYYSTECDQDKYNSLAHGKSTRNVLRAKLSVFYTWQVMMTAIVVFVGLANLVVMGLVLERLVG